MTSTPELDAAAAYLLAVDDTNFAREPDGEDLRRGRQDVADRMRLLLPDLCDSDIGAVLMHAAGFVHGLAVCATGHSGRFGRSLTAFEVSNVLASLGALLYTDGQGPTCPPPS